MSKQSRGIWSKLTAVKEEVSVFCQDLPKSKLAKVESTSKPAASMNEETDRWQ